MAMTVRKVSESSLIRVIVHRIADIRGGVVVKASEIVSDYLKEGTPISLPDANGVTHIIKFAALQADAANTDTDYKVLKGHEFKVGDVIMLATGAKAYAITAIDTSNADYDVITVGTTLGAVAKAGDSIYHAGKAGASGSAFKYAAAAIVGTGVKNIGATNLVTDAWVIAVTKSNNLPALIAAQMKGVIDL